MKLIASGDATSLGEFTGTVRIVVDVTQVFEFKEGEILVTKNTTPLFNPAMMKSKAMITEIGGMLSHTSIVARELGVPAIVNAKEITNLVKTGQTITVRATENGGSIYAHED